MHKYEPEKDETTTCVRKHEKGRERQRMYPNECRFAGIVPDNRFDATSKVLITHRHMHTCTHSAHTHTHARTILSLPRT